MSRTASLAATSPLARGIAISALLAAALVAQEGATGGAAPRLCLHPGTIILDHAEDRPRIVVLHVDAGGTMRDVTGEATLAIEGAAVAQLTPDLRIAPLAAGRAELVARAAGLEARVPIEVRDAAGAPAPSFACDVIPILTRQGCNAGGCHGAAQGKNGFRLSLFGFDPKSDHERITRELRGRRLAPGAPEESLLLAKPTLAVVHKGGRRLEKDADFYRTLLDWVRNGARNDAASAPTLVGLDVLPPELVITGPERDLRFLVRARWSDGSDEDVTELALLSTDDPATARVDGDRLVTGSRGEAVLLARFGTLAATCRVLVLPEGPRPAWTAPPATNVIDREIFAKLEKLGLPPAPRCSDETFLRRVRLDLTDLLPTVEETEAFLADTSPDKRRRLVDRLLQTPELADVLTLMWAEVLRIEPRRLDEKGVHHYTDHLRRAFLENRPFDAIVRELLVAEGPNFHEPAASYFLTDTDPKLLAENTAQVFTGVRLQCAQCHNHPFERWTMDDYYGFAAFFAQVGTKPAEDPRERVVFDRGSGEVRNPLDNQVAKPRVLGGGTPEIPKGKDRREVLARWLTAPENPYFAAHVANRMFARLFGRGIVDPPDDVRVSNPPSHPTLHRALGRRLVELGFDLRELAREICTSEAYQLAVRDEPAPARTFAGAAVRRLTAEQLLEAIAAVTEVPVDLPGLPPGGHVTELESASGDRFLEVFGRSARASACTCDRRSEPTLGQSLHLVNGPTSESRLAQKGSRLQRHLAAGSSDEAILEDLFLAAYSRRPTAAERERHLAALSKADARKTALEDLFWAVLNSKEFLFQH